MFDIKFYLMEKTNQIFKYHQVGCRFVIKQQKNTGDIYFCKLVSKDGECLETIVLKRYHNSETPFLEHSFATKHESSFIKQMNIRVPSYIYFDAENKIVVTKFVENNVTFEKYLLANRTILYNKTDLNWFRLAGRWLAHFHKVSRSNGQTTIDDKFVVNDLRRKWLSCFPESQKIEARFLQYANSIKREGFLVCNLSKMHREYGPGNILLSGADLYGIDFGNQETAPPYDDISYFMVACTTLNYFPHHPGYQQISINGSELREFVNGYLDHYAFTNNDLFSDKLFVLFLWKNLIRRMSGKLTQANRFPALFRDIVRSYLLNSYFQTENLLLNIL